jgi:cobalt-zinc-cadmium efflux system outer membrane protein
MMRHPERVLLLALGVIAAVGVWPAAGQPQNPWGKADSLEAIFHEADDAGRREDSIASLQDYLREAAERNPALRAAFYRWKSQLGNSDYSGSLPDPVLTYRYFIEHVETRVGPQNQGLSLRQEIPWPGTLSAESDAAQEAARAAYRKFQAMKLEVFSRVKVQYFEYYYLGKEIALTEENFSLLSFWESVVRTKYKAGLKGHPDILRVQVELGKMEDQLASLRARRAPTAARLRAAVNLPDSVVLPIPLEIHVRELPFDPDTVKAAVLRFNPDLQSLRHAIGREEASVRLAKRRSLPNFSLGVDYIDTGPALNPGTPESGKDPWIVGVSVSLPIWLGTNTSRTEEAEARQHEAYYDFIDACNRLMAIAEETLYEHGDALRKVYLYRNGLIPKAVQSLNTSYTSYQAGELDLLNVLDAQRRLLEFQLALERARADLGIQTAGIEVLTGLEATIPVEDVHGQ